MGFSSNFILLCLVPLIACHDEIHGSESIAVASEPEEFARVYDDVVTKPRNENVYREPSESQEISSPGHVVYPKEEENSRHAEATVEDSENAQNQYEGIENSVSAVDESSEQVQDVTGSDNSEPDTEEVSEVNGLEAVLLSLYGVRMNQSLSGIYSGGSGEPVIPGFNCTELHCLYGPDLDLTTQSGEEGIEEETTPSSVFVTSTSLRNDVESHKQVHDNNEQAENSEADSEDHSNNPDGVTMHEGVVHDASNNESRIRPENKENSQDSDDSDEESENQRFLVFNRSLIPEPNILMKQDEPENPDLPIIEQNMTNIGDMKMEYTMTNDQKAKIYLTASNISANLNVPNIIPLLKQCGVFPACQLEVTIEHDVIVYDELVKNLEVKCDPTSVSMMIAFVVILAVIVIISNMVIIVVTLRTRSLRKAHGYFKISLAIADLLTGTFVLTNISSNLVRFIYFTDEDKFQFLQLRRNEPVYSEAAFFGICAVLSQVVTVYSVLLLSVDSFLSIRWPMRYRIGDLMTTKRAVGLIAVVWIFALAVSALPILAYEHVRYGLSYCTFSYFPILEPIESHMSREDAFLARYIHVILYAVLVWGIPFIATWMLTLLTAYHSRGMLRHMSRSRGSPTVSGKIGRLERDILRTVSIVLLMLSITVLPMLICLIVVSVTSYDNPLCMEQRIFNMLFAAYYILVCGSFINVIVYNACHKEFRRAMFDFLCDAISFLFSWMCPALCDLRVSKSERSFRSRGTRRTTLSTGTKANKTTRKSVKGVENASTTLSNERTGELPSGFSYGRSCDQSESIGSDVPSSSRTVSTDTCLSTSTLNGSMSSEYSTSSQIITKIPAKRAASCNSVFLSTNHAVRRQDPR